MGIRPGDTLIRMREQPASGYRRALSWHCDPPPRGTPFVVVAEGWTIAGGMEIRDIHAIEALYPEEPDEGQ